MRVLEGHTRRVNALAVLADGRRVLCGANDNSLQLWDLATGETLRTLYGHTNPVWAVAVSADGSLIVAGSADGRIHIVEIRES